MNILYIEFNKSKSKQYNRACNLSKQFPNIEINNNITKCWINNVLEYVKIQNTIVELLEIVRKWKGTTVLLFDKPYIRAIDFSCFIKELRRKAGKYAVLIRDAFPLDVACRSEITYEDLPFPIVYYPSNYGAFFAFSKDIGEKVYFCECQKQAIYKSVKIRENAPLLNCNGPRTYSLSSDFFPETIALQSASSIGNSIEKLEFREKICFRCNNKVPMLKYCHPMYGGRFKQHYGWYINQESINLGIDPSRISTLHLFPDECSADFIERLKQTTDLLNGENHNTDASKDIEVLQKEYQRAIENTVRQKFGYPKIGESWISETLLFYIVQSIYPNDNVLHHYRPHWLEGLELDIFVPNHNLALEYQGIQHFKPVSHWGGEEQLKKQQERDARKKELCKDKGIKLICINYDEELSIAYVKNRIKNNQKI